ncbi:MAG: ABC transporter permease [Longimicrobiales bacterium]
MDEPEQVDAMRLTDGTLPILGIRPILGRAFTAEDDSPTSPETVILAHGYWQRRFGADPQVLGRTVTIDGRPRAVIGVMPKDLGFLHFDPALYLPFRIDRSKVYSGNFSFQGVARLRDGVTLADANADIARLIPVSFERYAGPVTLSMMRDAQFGPLVRPLAEDVIGDVGKVLWVLLGTVGLVLLIACANVANLGTVGIYGVISYVVSQRTREIGVRMALGANASDVRRLVLKHGLALAVIGVALGLVAAFALSRVMAAILFGVTPVDALTYAVVATTLAAIAVLASYIPARRATRVSPGTALRWE